MSENPLTRSHAEMRRVLRRAGYPEDVIERVLAGLPDPVDLERDGQALAREGLSVEALTDRFGGSP